MAVPPISAPGSHGTPRASLPLARLPVWRRKGKFAIRFGRPQFMQKANCALPHSRNPVIVHAQGQYPRFEPLVTGMRLR